MNYKKIDMDLMLESKLDRIERPLKLRLPDMAAR